MPHNHVVQQGECLRQIAASYGLPDYATIYNHPDNAEFKGKRPDPNLIFPGDRLVIPDTTMKMARVQTGAVHRFVVKLPKRTLRLAVADIDRERIANARYALTVDGELFEGTTDGQGMLEEEIPAQAQTATLSVGDNHWTLKIGYLNPLEDTDDQGLTGIQARLTNMGHDPGSIDGVLGPKTEAAIRAFQVANALPVTGELDPDVRDKILQQHGC